MHYGRMVSFTLHFLRQLSLSDPARTVVSQDQRVLDQGGATHGINIATRLVRHRRLVCADRILVPVHVLGACRALVSACRNWCRARLGSRRHLGILLAVLCRNALVNGASAMR